jgi:energy-coupling factor transporter ATP-binding protein EcfA2
MNARLTSPITRTGYSEQPSTGIAEALAAFLRQIQTIDQLPRKIGSRLTQRPLKKPIYMGFIATRSESRHQPSKEPYLIDLDDLREMTLVSGATGSGKTRVAQIIAEGASLYAPVIVIDPVGEFTGLIHTNMDASKERQFKLPNGISYEPEIYTLDDEGNQFSANLLLKPNIPEEFLATSADEASLILTDLVGDIRFRDIFRETVLENWRQEKHISCEEFVEACKRKAQGLKTSVKLERLLQFKMLMSGEALDVEELLQKRLVVFSLNSHLYTDTQRLAVVWFILRQILNYFLSQPHSDSTRAVVIEDEVHRLYAEGAPRSAASVLENMVKQGRAKGLAVVLISQSLHDLPGILTQANLRVLLRILEGEIQSYGDKFGMALARSLHSLEPRFGYVFHGSEEFYCAFRPTLSMPKGVTDYQEIRNYTSSQKNLKRFLETVTTHSSAQTRKAEQVVSVLSEDELRVKEALESLGGTAQSKRQLAQLAGVKGREKILQVVSRLEEKGYVKTDKVGSAVVVKLLRK